MFMLCHIFMFVNQLEKVALVDGGLTRDSSQGHSMVKVKGTEYQGHMKGNKFSVYL